MPPTHTVQQQVPAALTYVSALQWADVTSIDGSQSLTDLKDLQFGRKLVGRHGAVQLGPDMLLVHQQIGKGAFASVYKVSIYCWVSGALSHFDAVGHCCFKHPLAARSRTRLKMVIGNKLFSQVSVMGSPKKSYVCRVRVHMRGSFRNIYMTW